MDDDELSLLVAQAAEEFTSEIEAGENPSIDDYVSKYPQIAAVLRDVLPALNSLNADRLPTLTATESIHAPTHETNSWSPAASPELLGDFQLEEPIGRGGMGVVYRATQVSIGRTVAVKVLPFAATLDENQLQRFRNEVRAAGALNHPHIVPIYAVGEQRGVHYYAMQLIRGCSMAELIESIRTTEQPTLEPTDDTLAVANSLEITAGTAPSHDNLNHQIAVLGHQAALGLAHAHACGVTHRDIKPANLMIDKAGKLWITDFGLAHVDSGQSLTMPGDFIGTLRFMSPEQASGNTFDVDHRTDIYSLGISLYELATGAQAIAGESREQILSAVANDEPIPPRKLRPSLPIELETIILKCFEKDPRDRYASAEQLAADFASLLNNQPIAAKRRNSIDKARRWTRKNSLLVLATALVTTTMLAISSGAAVWIWHERNIANASMQAEHEERNRADMTLASAREAMDLYVKHAASLGSVDGMTPKQRESLIEVLRFYESLPPSELNDPDILYDTAVVRQSLANVNRALGNYQQAERDCLLTLTILEKLGSVASGDLRGELLRAKTLLHLGSVEGQIGKEVHVATRYRNAITVLEGLREKTIANEPQWSVPLTMASAKRMLAQRLILLGKMNEAADMASAAFQESQTLLHTKDPAVLHEVLTIRQENASLSFHAFGLASSRINLHQEMSATYEQATWLYEQFPKERLSAALVAQIAYDYSMVCDRLGKRKRAIELIQHSLSIRDELAARFPNRTTTLWELALAHDRYASLLHDERRFDEAIAQYRFGIELDEKLSQIVEYAESLNFRETAIGRKQNLSNVLYRTRNQDNFAECLRLREETVRDWKLLLESFDDRVDLLMHEAMARYALAECKSPAQAITLITPSIATIKSLAERHPETPQIRARLTTCLNGLAGHYHRKGDYENAIPIVEEAIAVAEKLAEEFPDTADYQGKLARRWHHLGRLALKSGNNSMAVDAFRKTAAIRQTLRDRFPEYTKPMHAVPNASAQAMLGIALHRLSVERPQHGFAEEAKVQFDTAVASLTDPMMIALGREIRFDTNAAEKELIVLAFDAANKREKPTPPDTP